MIVCFPLFFISPDRSKTESGEYRTGRKVEIFTSLRAAYVVFKKIKKKIKVQFSSECKIKFCGQLGAWLRQILGTLRVKNPPRVGKYKNLEMHNLKSLHISPGSLPPPPPPLGEADDKCIK